jgi:catabolite regulation protein CreA
MKLERVQVVVLAALLIITGLFVFQVSEVSGDPVFRQIQGIVDPNSTTTVRAWDSVQNGFVYYYIQNRTNEGSGTDPMETNPVPPPVVDFYDPPISSGITDWKPGDECILVVDREYGSYGTDHAGYVAFINVTLVATGGVQFAPTTELKKIPVPTKISNGTGWIEISWDALDDPNGLIAGYKVYRSTTNGTFMGDDDWELVGGTVSDPLTTTNFNDTTVSGGLDYYYSIKVVFTGYANNDPAQVDNYQNQIFGEGSGEVTSPVPPVDIDYIVIMDAANNMGNPIWIDWPADTYTLYNVGETDRFYAAGFNYTLGYIKDIDVDWTVINVFGIPDTTNGTVTPGPSTSTLFTANSTHGGVLIVRADFSAATETTNFTSYIIVIPPQPDYIQIQDAMGNVVTTMTYGVAEVDQFYAAGFNYTAGYIGEVEVDWASDFPSVGTVDPLGTMTNFTAQWVLVDSTCTVTATYAGIVSNSTGLLTVLYPRVDEIQIRTQDFGGGIELSDPANYPLYQKGYTTTFYGAQYNNSIGYIGSVSLTSTWVSNETTIVDVTSPGNITTVTCDPVNTGWVWVNLTDGVHQASTIVTVSDITVDYILIRDAPFGGGKNLCDPANYTSYPVGHTTTFWGAAYNYSVGYFKDVDVGSTWFSTDTSIVDAGSPGSSSPITCSNTIWGTVTISLTDFATGKLNTTQVTVLEPTVDTIMIRTDPDNLGSEVTIATYIVLETDLFYAAAYNTTAGYLGEREVVWTIDFPSVGQVTTPGLWTNFTAQQVAIDSTCTVTATYPGAIIDTTGLLTVLAPRIDYIQIEDELGNVITTMIYGVFDTDEFYAVAYNNT